MNKDDHDAKNSQGSGRDDDPAAESRVPEELRNWQVIDAESHVSGDTEELLRELDDVAQRDTRLETYDDVIILTAEMRRHTLALDESAVFTVGVQNNSQESLTIDLVAEETPTGVSLPDLPLRITLTPGGKQMLGLRAVQDKGVMLYEGDHAFQIVAYASSLPKRVARISCVVRAESVSAFHVRDLNPPRSIVSWWSPTARAELSVTNLGNHTAKFSVVGADAYRSCLFEFDTGLDDPPLVGQTTVSVTPLEKRTIGVTILSRNRSTIGLTANELPYKIGVEQVDDTDSVSGESANIQSVGGVVVSRPLIGPWHIAGVAAALAILLLVILMTSATMLVALRPSSAPVVVAPTQIPAPMIALVLSMDEPVPTSVSADTPTGVQPVMTLAPNASAVVQPSDGSLPMVQPEQVSAPGEPTRVPAASASVANQPQAARQPTAVSIAPSDPGSMTYAQMFREVGSRYDLNWRLLAAQGYVESSFDSTAVGSKGSIGIMQVHPDTWDEWAPFVDVNDPYDTYSNVLVAAVYLDYLRVTLAQVGYPQTEWMLAAYNWGPDKVLNLLNSGGDWTDLPHEVQQYASDILQIAQSIPEQ